MVFLFVCCEIVQEGLESNALCFSMLFFNQIKDIDLLNKEQHIYLTNFCNFLTKNNQNQKRILNLVFSSSSFFFSFLCAINLKH